MSENRFKLAEALQSIDEKVIYEAGMEWKPKTKRYHMPYHLLAVEFIVNFAERRQGGNSYVSEEQFTFFFKPDSEKITCEPVNIPLKGRIQVDGK